MGLKHEYTCCWKKYNAEVSQAWHEMDSQAHNMDEKDAMCMPRLYT